MQFYSIYIKLENMEINYVLIEDTSLCGKSLKHFMGMIITLLIRVG